MWPDIYVFLKNNYQVITAIGSLFVAACALIISLYYAKKSRELNITLLKRNAEHDHTNAILEIDKMLVQYPELWAVYDEHEMSKNDSINKDSIKRGRLEAFVYAHLNIFELVFEFYHSDVAKMSYRDMKYWEAWEKYIKGFITDSSIARQIINSPEAKNIYPEPFMSYMESSMQIIIGAQEINNK